jgi:SAM-dependent methyltransferase
LEEIPVKIDYKKALLCLVIAFPTMAHSQGPTAVAQQPTAAPANASATTQPTPITVQIIQPPTQPKNEKLEAIQAYAPYLVAILALLGVLGTALYTLYRGRMDARYAYASEIMKFRQRQVEEFYAPALTYIEQSRIVYEKLRWTIKQERKDISLEGFRLLDHIFEFKSDPNLMPLVHRILAIGKQLTGLIARNSGLIEGGITPTFIEYQGHFEILNAARKQKLDNQQTEGWHERGYYTRLLNREIAEGYKAVLGHIENYARAGDQIISGLFGQKAIVAGKYRRQLIENLRYYEDSAKNYAAKFDAFDLSTIRQRFIDSVEKTRHALPQPLAERVKILDAGCGTGRDMAEFLKKGYAVTAIDASPAMLRECRKKLTAALTLQNDAELNAAAKDTKCLEMTFDEIPYRSKFDGVWAAASLLHVPSELMEETIRTLIQALRPNGTIYMSFKYGRGEHEYDARFFSYYSRRQIRALLQRIQGVAETDIWLSDATGKNLPQQKQSWAWGLELIDQYDRSNWLNVLATRRHS